MLISRENLALLEAVGPEEFSCIKIDPEKGVLYATNKHSLYISRLPDIPWSDFPEVGTEGAHSPESSIVPASILAKAKKNLPKRGTFPPVLNYIQVLSTDTHHQAVTTDLNTSDVVAARHPERQFPDVEHVIEVIEEQPVMATTTISVKELERMTKIAKQHGEEYITLKFREEHQALTISGANGDLTGHIMPVRDAPGHNILCNNT